MSPISNDAAKRRMRLIFLLNGAADLAGATFCFYFGQSVLGLDHSVALIVSIGLAAVGVMSIVFGMIVIRPARAPRGGRRGGNIVDRG